MKTMLKIIRYQLRDVFRSRWIVAYGLFFLMATDLLFRFGGGGERVILSLMNAVLVVVPLVTVVIGTMYIYASREYIELLLAQPIRRPGLFVGMFVGLTLPLVAAVLLGVGLPFVYHGAWGAGEAGSLGLLLLIAVLLTTIFAALSFAIALSTEDRLRGLGAALGCWLFFAVVYDGLILFGIHLLSEYPLQKPVIASSLLNPIDLGRILLLLRMDVAAMMGFTGAVFQRFFGSDSGQTLALVAMLAWLAVPLAIAHRTFARKNF